MLSSSGEKKIHEILERANINFKEEYQFQDLRGYKHVPLRFDFCVFTTSGEIAFLIEFNGVQHYRPVDKFGGVKTFSRQRQNDLKKIQYCLEHKIKLVVIPYYEESKLSLEYIMRAAGY